MASIQLKKISLYYESVGTGKPLLFLHGLGSCGADWLLQIPYFSQNYQVITPDLRGHGKSQKQADSYAIADLAKDMAELLEALEIASCDVVGLSLGSFVALQLALDFPQKVKSLTLAGTTSCIKDVGQFLLSLKKILITLCPMWLVAKMVAYGCFPEQKKNGLRTLCEERLKTNDKKVYQKLFLALLSYDVAARLSEIRCPVLLIAGEHDLLLPARHAEKMAQLLSHATLYTIKGAGHVMPIDSAEAFNKRLGEFLQ